MVTSCVFFVTLSSKWTQMAKNNIIPSDATIQAISSNNLYQDACIIIDKAKRYTYKAVDDELIKRNWLLGLRIQHEVLKEKRAEYGEEVIKQLSKELSSRYGRGFQKSNLYLFVSFYQNHPDFFQLPIGESRKASFDEIFQSLTGKSAIRLSWTHYSIILQEMSEEGRIWYENEAVHEGWGTRTLQRNVSSQYYHRLFQSQDKDIVRGEMPTLSCSEESIGNFFLNLDKKIHLNELINMNIMTVAFLEIEATSVQLDLFETANIRLEVPYRHNQKNWKPTFIPFAKARKRIETDFSQMCDQFMICRNYAKETVGLFTRIIGKISAFTAMQYLNHINNRPIGRVKYALA